MSLTIKQQKEAMRKEVKQWRLGLTRDWQFKKSEQVCRKIITAFLRHKPSSIGCYYALNYEVDTTPLITYCWQQDIKLAIPSWDECTNQYRFCSYEPGQKVKTRKYAIAEPIICRPISLASLDIIVCPGLAFDDKGYRLGWGLGYYDKLLAQTNATQLKIGVCFEKQVFPYIPHDTYDIPMDFVITEENIRLKHKVTF